MKDDHQKKYDGRVIHRGADHSAPYPLSRLAPAIELLDLAKEVAQADSMLTGVATGKLRVIAEQMKALQKEAKKVLTQVQQDQELHRVPCHFKRQPGRFYHLYRKSDGVRYFSMLSPDEWGGQPPHEFLGSFRLEADMSWTAASQATADDTRLMIQSLLDAKLHGEK